MSGIESLLPVIGTGKNLRVIEQTTTAGTVDTEVVAETNLAVDQTSQVVITAADTVLVPASAGIRHVVIWTGLSADTGFYGNVGAAATAANALYEAGGVLKANTSQAIHAIRAGTSDVTAYVMTGVPA